MPTQLLTYLTLGSYTSKSNSYQTESYRWRFLTKTGDQITRKPYMIQHKSITGLEDNRLECVVGYVTNFSYQFMTSLWRHQYEHFFTQILQNSSLFNLNLHQEYEELAPIWGKNIRWEGVGLSKNRQEFISSAHQHGAIVPQKRRIFRNFAFQNAKRETILRIPQVIPGVLKLDLYSAV